MTNYLVIGDNVQVKERYTSGVTSTWEGVLKDLDDEYAYVQRGQSTVREKVPRENVISLADRSQDEIRELIGNPIQVHAPWNVGNWSWRRFPTIEAANQALAELRAALPETYVRSTSDPLISVGTYGRRGWSWS